MSKAIREISENIEWPFYGLFECMFLLLSHHIDWLIPKQILFYCSSIEVLVGHSQFNEQFISEIHSRRMHITYSGSIEYQFLAKVFICVVFTICASIKKVVHVVIWWSMIYVIIEHILCFVHLMKQYLYLHTNIVDKIVQR